MRVTSGEKKRVWAWWVLAIVVMTAVVLQWRLPVVVELNRGEGAVVTCSSFVSSSAQVSLWPYSMDINEWVKDVGDTTEQGEVIATLGMLDRCGVARDNRQLTVILTAIAGATVLLLTRPRLRRRPENATAVAGEVAPEQEPAKQEPREPGSG